MDFASALMEAVRLDFPFCLLQYQHRIFRGQRAFDFFFLDFDTLA
jgi:hypothetical protein